MIQVLGHVSSVSTGQQLPRIHSVFYLQCPTIYTTKHPIIFYMAPFRALIK